MSYKSPRLLRERVEKEMAALRKLLMDDVTDAGQVPGDLVPAYHTRLEYALHQLNEMREFIDELGKMAMRPSIDDVNEMTPANYVATMKPLVGNYHRLLSDLGLLASCLSEDLQANGILLVVIGDAASKVYTAHNRERPEAALVIETMLAALDNFTKQTAEEGVAHAEKALGIAEPANDAVESPSEPGEPG